MSLLPTVRDGTLFTLLANPHSFKVMNLQLPRVQNVRLNILPNRNVYNFNHKLAIVKIFKNIH